MVVVAAGGEMVDGGCVVCLGALKCGGGVMGVGVRVTAEAYRALCKSPADALPTKPPAPTDLNPPPPLLLLLLLLLLSGEVGVAEEAEKVVEADGGEERISAPAAAAAAAAAAEMMGAAGAEGEGGTTVMIGGGRRGEAVEDEEEVERAGVSGASEAEMAEFETVGEAEESTCKAVTALFG